MNKEILHKAIDFLSRRDHSKQELYNKLLKKEFDNDEIIVVLDFLQAKNYFNDLNFAEMILRSRVSKGYGWRYIVQELQQKGVSREVVSQLQENHEIDWYYQAELAYNKRFANAEIKDQKDKAKRIRFLQYRGFSTDEIFALIA